MNCQANESLLFQSQTINDNLGSILPSTTSPSSESAVQVLKPSASSSLNSTLLAALTGHSKVDSGNLAFFHSLPYKPSDIKLQLIIQF